MSLEGLGNEEVFLFAEEDGLTFSGRCFLGVILGVFSPFPGQEEEEVPGYLPLEEL